VDKQQYFTDKYELTLNPIEDYNKKNIVFDVPAIIHDTYSDLLNEFIIHYLLNCAMNKKPEKSQVKYHIVRTLVLENVFLPDSFKTLFINAFGKAQRIYRALNRFAFLYKYKRAHIPIQSDLFMNPIDDISKNYIVTVFQGKMKYLFTLSDLLQIIKSALFFCPYELEVEPFMPKNPYNNIPFSRAILYNLYFHIKTKCQMMTIPLYFHHFFLSDFTVTLFLIQNETILQKNAVKQFIFSSATSDNVSLMNNLRSMLSENLYTRRLRIHRLFPQDELLDIFRPYLYLYYLVWYVDLFESETEYYKSALSLALTRFYKFNPSFGRIILRFDKICPANGREPCVISPFVRFFKNDKNVLEEILEKEPDISSFRFDFEFLSKDSLTKESLSNDLTLSKEPEYAHKLVRQITFNKKHIECNTKNY
jgi:hypothetical protein